MMKRIMIIIGVVMLSLMGVMTVSRPAMAVDITVTSGHCGSGTFLFMRPWYYSLECDSSGNLEQGQFSSDKIGDTIKKIVLVVIDDILRIVGVLAAGFLIYGGIRYSSSGGDVGGASKGKRTIQVAITGMVISLVGQLIVNTFEKIAQQNATGAQVTIGGTISGTLNLMNVDSEKLIGTVINFVIGVATLVAVGFIIYSGINMITAYGNTEKLAKSKRGIAYSVAGLLIAMLAFAIVNFALGGLTMAMPNGGNTDAFDLVNAVFGWIVGVSGFLAVAGIVMGGIQFMTSTGDAQKAQKAKHTIVYSVIGLMVALSAGAIISFVIKSAFGS